MQEIVQKHTKSESQKGKDMPKSQKIQSKAQNFQFAHTQLFFFAEQITFI